MLKTTGASSGIDTCADLRPYVGKRGLFSCRGLRFPVDILDSRARWGRIDLLITPVGGEGSIWVESQSVILP